jgi:hypothetical protein
MSGTRYAREPTAILIMVTPIRTDSAVTGTGRAYSAAFSTL